MEQTAGNGQETNLWLINYELPSRIALIFETMRYQTSCQRGPCFKICKTAITKNEWMNIRRSLIETR